jgi:hypothetical protein
MPSYAIAAAAVAVAVAVAVMGMVVVLLRYWYNSTTLLLDVVVRGRDRVM